MATIISFINHKGGVGKTTSCLSLAAVFAGLEKKRILLIDLDPQANLTEALGFDKDSSATIYEAMKKEVKLGDILKTRTIETERVTYSLDLLPSAIQLGMADIEFSSRSLREFILKKFIEKNVHGYDYIFIDCSPSISSLLVQNAIVASDYYLVPLQAEYFSTSGLVTVINKIAQLAEEVESPIQPIGIFATRYNPKIRRKFSNDIVESVKGSKLADIMCQTYIRESIAVTESQANGQDLLEYWSNSGRGGNPMEDYIKLSEELLARLN